MRFNVKSSLNKTNFIEAIVVVIGLVLSRLFVKFVTPKVSSYIPGEYDNIIVGIVAVPVIGLIPFHRKMLVIGALANLVLMIMSKFNIGQ